MERRGESDYDYDVRGWIQFALANTLGRPAKPNDVGYFTTNALQQLKTSTLSLSPFPPSHRRPPSSSFSVSITYATRGEDRGKIIKLVTDAVLDRQIGNTNGLSGIAGAAYAAGSTGSSNDALAATPPLVALGRVFGRNKPPASSASRGKKSMPPFPDSVMIQLAKGVLASDMGRNDPNLLSEGFAYVEPLMGPMDKGAYLELFGAGGEYDVRGGVPDLDLGLEVS